MAFSPFNKFGDWHKSPQSYFPALSFIKKGPPSMPRPKENRILLKLGNTLPPLRRAGDKAGIHGGAGRGLRNQASVNSNPGADIDFLLILALTLFPSFYRNKVNRTHQSPRRVFTSASHLQGAEASFLWACHGFTWGYPKKQKS